MYTQSRQMILPAKMLVLLLVLCAQVVNCSTTAAKTNVYKQPSNTFVRHFVSVKFKETTTPEQVQQVLDAFKEMKSGIPEIYSMEFGPDVSVEGKSKGFTHGFLLTFASPKDRDAYLIHPVHTKFLASAKPLLEDLFIFDFLTGKPGK